MNQNVYVRGLFLFLLLLLLLPVLLFFSTIPTSLILSIQINFGSSQLTHMVNFTCVIFSVMFFSFTSLIPSEFEMILFPETPNSLLFWSIIHPFRSAVFSPHRSTRTVFKPNPNSSSQAPSQPPDQIKTSTISSVLQ